MDFDITCVECWVGVALGILLGRLRLPFLEKFLPVLTKHDNHDAKKPEESGQK